jgi:nitrate reductase gamma subunit
MADVPWAYRLHILLAFSLFALWPFTRLIHIWSVPVPYVFRSHLLVRKRCPDFGESPRSVRH